MTWTGARIAQLTGLWAAGASASDIAAALGGEISRSAVLGKLHRLKLLRSRKSASEPKRYDGLLAARPPVRTEPRVAPPLQAARIIPPQPPRSPWREAAFAPLEGVTPRPWLSRAFGECAFPVGGDGGDLLSCCAPVRSRTAYCPEHHRIVFKTASPVARAAEARRWAERVEQWAA